MREMTPFDYRVADLRRLLLTIALALSSDECSDSTVRADARRLVRPKGGCG